LLVEGLERDLLGRMREQEEVWFPLYEQRAADDRHTRVLRLEHHRIARALSVMKAGATREDSDELEAGARELAAVLRAHVLKEERILAPLIDDGVG